MAVQKPGGQYQQRANGQHSPSFVPVAPVVNRIYLVGKVLFPWTLFTRSYLVRLDLYLDIILVFRDDVKVHEARDEGYHHQQLDGGIARHAMSPQIVQDEVSRAIGELP